MSVRMEWMSRRNVQLSQPSPQKTLSSASSSWPWWQHQEWNLSATELLLCPYEQICDSLSLGIVNSGACGWLDRWRPCWQSCWLEFNPQNLQGRRQLSTHMYSGRHEVDTHAINHEEGGDSRCHSGWLQIEIYKKQSISFPKITALGNIVTYQNPVSTKWGNRFF